ncbi:hypothetical protein QJQ45_005999 [Haematococcus lacustris]|nr:hypothetical protein QJQ45_005999 [Haematococcus lacustris]
MAQRSQAALVAWLVFAAAQASLCTGQAIVEPAVVPQGAQQDVAFAFYHLATDFPQGCAPAACRFTRAQPRALAVVPAILEAQDGLIAARCQLPAFMVSTAGHVSARLLCAEQATGQPAAIDVLPHHSGLSLIGASAVSGLGSPNLNSSSSSSSSSSSLAPGKVALAVVLPTLAVAVALAAAALVWKRKQAAVHPPAAVPTAAHQGGGQAGVAIQLS